MRRRLLLVLSKSAEKLAAGPSPLTPHSLYPQTDFIQTLCTARQRVFLMNVESFDDHLER